ncbi:MAG TPA: endonuclease V [candidate division Zixibacteria bacterium]
MSYPKLPNSHPWSVSLEEAKSIQEKLSVKVILQDDFKKIETVAGVGIIFSKTGDEVFVSCVIFSFPEMKILHICFGRGGVRFPYTPGFFAFSAGPALISTLEKMPKPDLIIFPGRGIAHPRKLGLASHLGVLFDLPTIACSRTPLWRDYPKLSPRKGEFVIMKGEDQAPLGAVIRTRAGVKPIFVTPGHKISVRSAVRIVLECSPKFRIPEPLRQAHIAAERLILHKENNF